MGLPGASEPPVASTGVKPGMEAIWEWKWSTGCDFCAKIIIYKEVDINDPEYFNLIKSIIKSKIGSIQFIQEGCNDEFAIHFVKNNTLYHVCYVEGDEITIMPEAVMGEKGEWIPITPIIFGDEI